ncbi:transglutaminase family protein [Arenibaculum pallidiluteum]|uniref:transglutaminase family protein n=1 Tax=Arenibaculum pallidiluteum TaxID=2812559 RepID=UPI001A9655F1|nr:transglutaminase family protein [Arenibaculum pallidiluteum]
MRYRVRHVTTYTYSSSVQVSHHAVRLCPRATPWQSAASPVLSLRPEPTALGTWQQDYFGNPVLFFTIQQSHSAMTVEAETLVEVMPPLPVDPRATPPWETVRARLRRPRGTEEREAVEFLFDSQRLAQHHTVTAYARESFPPGRPILAGVLDLTRRIHADFTYDPTATDVDTAPAEVIRLKRGVCQDFAHLEIACLRALGLPARYVSGYILTHPPPGGEKLVGGDASHAWVSAFVPGSGWIDVDPTNNTLARDEHVTLAWGRDYDDVSPLKGVVIGGGDHSLAVTVDVSPVRD